MKTKKELNALKEEVEKLNKKLAELSDEELEQVSGGSRFQIVNDGNCGCTVTLMGDKCSVGIGLNDPDKSNPCKGCKYL